jgi:hypothetical protein
MTAGGLLRDVRKACDNRVIHIDGEVRFDAVFVRTSQRIARRRTQLLVQRPQPV